MGRERWPGPGGAATRPTPRRLAVLVPLAPLMGVVSACGGRDLPPPPANVTFAMREYGFSFDRQVPRGRVVVQARNEGQLEHELVLLALPDDFELTVDEQLHSDTRRAFPTRARVPPRQPGGRGVFAVNLDPGRYAVVCFVADTDGESHALKGMSAEFRVE